MKKTMIRVLSLALMLTVVSGGTTVEAAGTGTPSAVRSDIVKKQASKASATAYTATIVNCKSYVNVRSAPSNTAKRLGTARKGATYSVKKAYYNSAWHQISYNGKTGYVNKAYAALKEKKSASASSGKTTRVTYLYASASASSKKLLKLGKNSMVNVLGISGSYYKVNTVGKTVKTGYVPASHVSVISGKALTAGQATAANYIYASASASSKKLAQLSKGQTANIYAISGSYYQVNSAGVTGYALRSKIKVGSGKTAATPTPVPTAAPTATPAPSASTANSDAEGYYTISNAQFGIKNNGTSARATTDGINRALEWAKAQGYNKIRFSTGTYLIQCNWNNRYIAPTDGILVPSGMTLDLGSSTFKLEANSYPAYSIISVVGKSGVTIKGGTLIGDLGQHVYAASSGSGTHEWGFGICISASTNVLIQGVTIKNTTGDGIILEGSYESLANGGKICSNIRIYDCDISSCRRQGISVIGATGSEIARNRIYGISGTDPQYGIDVETEFDYIVDNLKIHDNTIWGCSGGAINCNKGSNYEVYNNTCTGNNIIAVRCSNVKIYGNTIKNSFIRVMNYSSNVTVENNNLDSNSWVFFG